MWWLPRWVWYRGKVGVECVVVVVVSLVMVSWELGFRGSGGSFAVLVAVAVAIVIGLVQQL